MADVVGVAKLTETMQGTAQRYNIACATAADWDALPRKLLLLSLKYVDVRSLWTSLFTDAAQVGLVSLLKRGSLAEPRVYDENVPLDRGGFLALAKLKRRRGGDRSTGTWWRNTAASIIRCAWGTCRPGSRSSPCSRGASSAWRRGSRARSTSSPSCTACAPTCRFVFLCVCDPFRLLVCV